MAFSVHTFETKPNDANLGFSFHERISEGRELFFLCKFPEDSKDPQSIAEAIFGVALHVFETSKIKDSYDRFEEALKAANMEARKFAAHIPGDLDVVMAFFDFNNLYLSQSGEAEVYLLRDGNISQISETPEDGADLFLNILNGQVAVEDSIILTTHRILRFVTTNKLVDLFSRTAFSEGVALLRQELSTATDEDFLVTVIGIGKNEEIASAGFLSRILPGKQNEKQNNVQNVSDKNIDDTNDPDLSPPEIEISTPLAVNKNVATEIVLEAETTDAEKENDYEILDDEKKPSALSLEQEPDLSQELPSEHSYNSSRFSNFFSRFSLPSIFADKYSKNLVMSAGFVFVVLAFWVGVKIISNYESEEEMAMRGQLSIAKEALQQADTFLLQGDRGQAGEFLRKSQVVAQDILKSDSKSFRSDAQFLLAAVEEKQLQVENARKITPNILADLSMKNQSVEALGILELKGSLFAFDSKKIYKTIRNIVEKGLTVSEKESIVTASAREDQGTITMLSSTPRIIEYRDGVISPMNTADETWKNGIDIATYGKYVYFLDPVENQIWKYERLRDKYRGAIAYNKGSDLSRAVSMTIDGSIYILSDDGTIQKLFRGEKEKYSFRDLPSLPFQGADLKIFTRQELDFIYILDSKNSRVLVFVKGDQFATYKKQVIFDVPDAIDFTVDEAGQRVNIVTKDKIYEFSL